MKNLRSLMNPRFCDLMHKIRTQRRFLRNNCKLSKSRIITDSIIKGKNFIMNQRYDAVFVGSDTVWDVRLNGGAPQPPNLYFLPSITNLKKIAFGVSMDKGNPDILDQQRWTDIIDLVNDFNCITVRDAATMDKLESGGIKKENMYYMPDPTTLWDIKKEAVIPENLKDKKVSKIAGLAVSSMKLKSELNRQLNSLGYKVINLLGKPLSGQMTPSRRWDFRRRLGVYCILDLMVTDRFHGSIFSLRLGKIPVLMVEPDYYYPIKNSKGRDLFKRLGISEFVWRYEINEKIPGHLIIDFIDKSMGLDWSRETEFKEISNLGKSAFNHIDRLILT